MRHSLLGKIALVAFTIFIIGIIGSFAFGTKNGFVVSLKSAPMSKAIELDGAKEVEVDLKMGVGELSLSGGSDELMTGDFYTNKDSMQPIINYDLNRGNGALRIEQPSQNFMGFKNFVSEWDIQLTDGVPIKLKVDTGAGESELYLSGLKLKDLNIGMGVGEAMIDLSGKWEESFNVNIDGGVGDMHIILPSEIGVRMNIDQGVGNVDVKGLEVHNKTYTNDIYDTADVKIEIDINTGVGSVEVEVK